MCFLGIVLLKIHTIIISIIILVCNTMDIVKSIENVGSYRGYAKSAFIISMVLNSFLTFAISFGSYGVIRHKKLPLKLFLFTLLAFFICKLMLAEIVDGINGKIYELLTSPWYHLDTALSLLCLIFVSALYLRLTDEADLRSQAICLSDLDSTNGCRHLESFTA
ncbi:uncharacterized protein [Drosophila virilis]|uniref:Uncharacterized protein, isoform A n=1 Tax=Drosophila virilis TaxID=7244 RepID=A0A0Q9WHN9_DROVI|nr:uncharacterized protein Dvir_GJ26452, isoform A [Drosophila virilis]KRF84121.1 uncharacterized protein Dvir_GJ26452, isoform B [Drosophila virilis]